MRLLKNIFRVGLFENPYLVPATSRSIAGNPESMTAGYEAQLKSVVMLKNKEKILPIKGRKTVFIPKPFRPVGRNFLGMETPEKLEHPINLEIVNKYFNVTENSAEADFALVCIESPESVGGFNGEDVRAGGSGYVPISLQFSDYTASDVRDPSLAGGDPLETTMNRSYNGKTTRAINSSDLTMVLDASKNMPGKPVIVVMKMNNPSVFDEFEKSAAGILVHFGVQDQALLDIISGKIEPSGLLPMQMPASMETVENQFEDVAHDLVCHRDEAGNLYDFAFGLNWKGVIADVRVKRYKKSK